MGPVVGMMTGMAGAGAGAGLAGTLGAGLQGALGATPIGAALGAAGVPGLSKGPSAVASNPITSAVSAMVNPSVGSGAQNGFTPGPTGAASAKVQPVVNATPTQSYSGAVAPQALWGDLKSNGFNDAQSAALLGNMKQESEFRPGIINPGEGAQGLIQWRQDRLANLQKFAAAQGKSYTDPGVQVAFIKHEMQTTESKVGQRFLAASNVQDANAALKDYIRYGSPPDKGGIDTRLNNANGFYSQFTGTAPVAGVASAAATGTPNATPAPQQTEAQSLVGKAQQVAQALKTMHAQNAPAGAPGSMAPAAVGTDPQAFANRREALLAPAQQILQQLRNQPTSGTQPVIGGQPGRVSI